jgi:hypothetical protein
MHAPVILHWLRGLVKALRSRHRQPESEAPHWRRYALLCARIIRKSEQLGDYSGGTQ